MEETLKHRLKSWLSRPVKANSSADVAEISGTLATTVGDVRRENQDRAVLARFSPGNPSQHAFIAAVLCDGMGGMVDGAKCAELAVALLLTLAPFTRQRFSGMIAAFGY